MLCSLLTTNTSQLLTSNSHSLNAKLPEVVIGVFVHVATPFGRRHGPKKRMVRYFDGLWANCEVPKIFQKLSFFFFKSFVGPHLQFGGCGRVLAIWLCSQHGFFDQPTKKPNKKGRRGQCQFPCSCLIRSCTVRQHLRCSHFTPNWLGICCQFFEPLQKFVLSRCIKKGGHGKGVMACLVMSWEL